MGEKQLSEVEAELYDRQIRLWGIESQERLVFSVFTCFRAFGNLRQVSISSEASGR